MADVKWIKIVTDIFNDEKMLLIESLPESDGIIVIWFKLLCLAGKVNNHGVLLINEKIPYTDEMLSTIFRRKLNIIRLALETFKNLGMIEIINNTITIPNWGKHQNLDAIEKRREYQKEYMREYRQKQEKLVLQQPNCKPNSNTNSDPNVNLICKTNVSTLDIDKEIDKEEDIDIIYNYAKIINYLNEKANTNYKSSSKKTQELIRARINEKFTDDDFFKVIDNKCNDWLGTEYEKFLRPETLFSNKFESYLNQKVVKKSNIKREVGTPSWMNNQESQEVSQEELEEVKQLLKTF